MITGKTKLIGLLGYPVGHSFSPAIHNAAFDALELDYIYVPLSVEPAHLGQAVAGLKAMGFVGANVTIPHKVSIMPFLDELDGSAEMVGAVNTIAIREGRCIGYNTDVQGFVQSLIAKKITIKAKNAVIMGAGGGARAVAYGLIEQGIEQIIIGARSNPKAQEFVKLFPAETNIQGCNWHEGLFTDAITKCDILINCTPIGMASSENMQLPINWTNLKSNAVVCDLIYNPALTEFLIHAQERGHEIINGGAMLVEQGALAFELWTGKSAPRNIMSATLAKFI